MFTFDECAEVSSISHASFKHGTRAHRLPLQLVAGMHGPAALGYGDLLFGLLCCWPKDAFVQALDSVSVTSSWRHFPVSFVSLSDCRFSVDFWLTNPMSLLLAPSGCPLCWAIPVCMYVCM
jgi:hypothetical protein